MPLVGLIAEQSGQAHFHFPISSIFEGWVPHLAPPQPPKVGRTTIKESLCYKKDHVKQMRDKVFPITQKIRVIR